MKNQLIKRQFFVKAASFCWYGTYRIARTFTNGLTKYLNKGEKVKPVAVPLDTTPERPMLTIKSEILTRASLLPAPLRTRLVLRYFQIPIPSRQRGRETRQIPFLHRAQFRPCRFKVSSIAGILFKQVIISSIWFPRELGISKCTHTHC